MLTLFVSLLFYSKPLTIILWSFVDLGINHWSPLFHHFITTQISLASMIQSFVKCEVSWQIAHTTFARTLFSTFHVSTFPHFAARDSRIGCVLPLRSTSKTRSAPTAHWWSPARASAPVCTRFLGRPSPRSTRECAAPPPSRPLRSRLLWSRATARLDQSRRSIPSLHDSLPSRELGSLCASPTPVAGANSRGDRWSVPRSCSPGICPGGRRSFADTCSGVWTTITHGAHGYAERRIQRQNLVHQLASLFIKLLAKPHRARVRAIPRGVVHWRGRRGPVRVLRDQLGFHLRLVDSVRELLDSHTKLDFLHLVQTDHARRNRYTQTFHWYGKLWNIPGGI